MTLIFASSARGWLILLLLTALLIAFAGTRDLAAQRADEAHCDSAEIYASGR